MITHGIIVQGCEEMGKRRCRELKKQLEDRNGKSPWSKKKEIDDLGDKMIEL